MYHLIDVIVRKEGYLTSKRYNKTQLDFFPSITKVLPVLKTEHFTDVGSI